MLVFACLCENSGWTGPGPAEIALFGNETISPSDLRHYATAVSLPYRDPLQTFVTSKDANEREDAKQFVASGLEGIVWVRHYARLAQSAGAVVAPQEQAGITSAYYSCVGGAYDSDLRKKAREANEDNIADLYRLLGKQVVRPELRDVSYICRFTSGGAELARNEHIQRQLESVREEIISGQVRFEEAAERYSEAPSAANGGKAGTISATEKLNPRFMHLVFSLAADTISSVTLLHNGYYILRVGAIHPAVSPTLDDVFESADLKQQLLNLASQTSVSDVLAHAKKQFPEAKSDDEAMGRLALSRGFDSTECKGVREMAEQYKLAFGYFAEKHLSDITPSEQEIRSYYGSHKSEMFGEGIWRLTKFLVPAESKRGGRIRSRDEAAGLAEQVRKEVAGGSDPELLRNQFAGDGLQITPPLGWIQSTGDAKADETILQLAPGSDTQVYLGHEGAYFFRVESKRQMPILPLDAQRQNIINILTREKFEKAKEADRKALAAQLQLRIFWDKL